MSLNLYTGLLSLMLILYAVRTVTRPRNPAIPWWLASLAVFAFAGWIGLIVVLPIWNYNR